MRILLIAALALAVSAQAQDPCSQESPCVWSAAVDADGFSDANSLNGTQGDWVRFSFFNEDEAAHTVHLAGYELEWHLPPYEFVDTESFQLHTAGEFELTDVGTGDQVMVLVTVNDAFEVGEGQEAITDPGIESEQPKKSPGVTWPLLATLLVGLALRRR